jgi:hypothetical protein
MKFTAIIALSMLSLAQGAPVPKTVAEKYANNNGDNPNTGPREFKDSENRGEGTSKQEDLATPEIQYGNEKPENDNGEAPQSGTASDLNDQKGTATTNVQKTPSDGGKQQIATNGNERPEIPTLGQNQIAWCTGRRKMVMNEAELKDNNEFCSNLFIVFSKFQT